MFEEGKKRKVEDDRDGDSNVNGGVIGFELFVFRIYMFIYKRYNLKYFKFIRCGLEFVFDVFIIGWLRVLVNEY